MKAITENIYIEDQYPGATLGVINMPHGLIQVDAPPAPEDGRAWRAALLNLGGGTERLLVNLDAHPDRTLGARAMDCMVIAQEKTAHVFRTRPATFKAQGEESGSEWESIPGLGNIRWVTPEITFSHQMAIHWGESDVVLEHHPGPAAGAAWVIVPEAKVVFVGDAVLKNQPPFLAGADLGAWLDELKLLLSSAYRNWLVISGRGGVAAVDVIRGQKDFLEHVITRIEKASQKKSPVEAVDNLVMPLLNMFKIPSSLQQKYAKRLRYGLHHYYIRHYRPAVGPGTEE
jgi:glyoxylase-like metal-dependent hydrolase (beta-lactamase superfamily II)